MTAKIHELKPEPDEDVIYVLRDALKLAENGELSGVHIVGELSRAGELYSAGTFSSGTTLIGYLEYQKAKVLQCMLVGAVSMEDDGAS